MAGPFAYQRREPEKTLLYQLVQNNWLTFQAEVDAGGGTLPSFVQREIDAYLKCGILGHGFVNVRCDDCRQTRPVAFSCERRGFCPGCTGKRMASTAAHMVDSVFPDVPVRQWVLTVPHHLRFMMAREPELTGVVLRLFVRRVSAWYRRQARAEGVRGRLKTGGVTVIQRFGSGLALNVHFHSVLVDGVYVVDEPGAPPFVRVSAPSDADVARIAMEVCQQVIATTESVAQQVAAEERDIMDAVAAASVQSLIATGQRCGQRVMRLGADPFVKFEEFVVGPRCAMVEGFNIHANTNVAGSDRQGRERLLRYIARPPVSEERLSVLADGRVSVRLKHPWRDGTTHVAFTPTEFMEKLAAIVPRPRANLVRYHGVFAPAAGDRGRIVPSGQCDKGGGAVPAMTAKRWSEMMQRVFALDVLQCPQCLGRMRVVGEVCTLQAITKVLKHLGLPAQAPLPHPARAPPQQELAFGSDSGDWAA